MLVVPAPLAGVYVTWQVADVELWVTSVHGEPVNEPAALLVKSTVPVGVVGLVEVVSATVTVHVVAWFIATEGGEQLTAVAVESLPKPIDVDPWLTKWIVSPE